MWAARGLHIRNSRLRDQKHRPVFASQHNLRRNLRLTIPRTWQDRPLVLQMLCERRPGALLDETWQIPTEAHSNEGLVTLLSRAAREERSKTSIRRAGCLTQGDKTTTKKWSNRMERGAMPPVRKSTQGVPTTQFASRTNLRMGQSPFPPKES